VNAVHAGSVDADPAKWRVTQEMLEREIANVKKAKAAYSGKRRARAEGDRVSAELIGREIAFEGAGSSWPWTWREDGGSPLGVMTGK